LRVLRSACGQGLAHGRSLLEVESGYFRRYHLTIDRIWLTFNHVHFRILWSHSTSDGVQVCCPPGWPSGFNVTRRPANLNRQFICACYAACRPSAELPAPEPRCRVSRLLAASSWAVGQQYRTGLRATASGKGNGVANRTTVLAPFVSDSAPMRSWGANPAALNSGTLRATCVSSLRGARSFAHCSVVSRNGRDVRVHACSYRMCPRFPLSLG